MRVELRHLRYFVAVAEELSFTRAAQRLHMAQPPLSTQVRQLERALGVQLLDRSRRAIRLTPAGTALLTEARRLLVGVDQTLEAVQRIGRGEVGRLTIGFVPSASNTTVPNVLRAHRQAHPDVETYLREMAPDDLVRAVHAGGIDIGLLYLPLHDPALEVRVVTSEPLIAALPDDHSLTRRRHLRVADLAEAPFILPAQHRMPGLLARVNDACHAAGFTPRAVQKDVWLLQTILALVAAGIGVALVPASLQNLRRAGVTYRAFRDSAPTVELGAIWRRDEIAPVLDTFLAELLPAEVVTGTASL